MEQEIGRRSRFRAVGIILPILGRDESYTEYVLLTAWRKRISDEFGFTIKDWIPKNIDVDTYFQKVFVPYYSYWSFGENLPVIQREGEMENPASISAAYGRITSLITSGLDWTVLEQSANPAEIELLRSKATLGEAKSVEIRRQGKALECVCRGLLPSGGGSRSGCRGLFWVPDRKQKPSTSTL